MKKQLTHAAMKHFSVRDNCLVIGGVPIPQLVNRVGQTPFFAYDRHVIKSQCETFRRHIPDKINLHYAVKANPMPDVVQYLATIADGFDVSSVGEMQIALNSGISPECVNFSGPGKTSNELRCAIAAGVIINIESETELQRTVAASEQAGIQARIALRINPDFELKSSGMKMGGGAKPFGIDAERIPDVLKHIETLDVYFHGFHIFMGSQNLRSDFIIEAQANMFSLLTRLADATTLAVNHINIGGGFGIPYFPGESWLELDAIGANLNNLLENASTRFSNTQFVIELGRYLVGPAGVYITQIIDRKVSRGQIYLVTDGGLHHHLAASGNFGQVIRKNYPVAIANRMAASDSETSTVVGRLCTPLDVLADKMELSKASEGDYVAIFQSGAYGLTASPTRFLGHPSALEVLI